MEILKSNETKIDVWLLEMLLNSISLNLINKIDKAIYRDKLFAIKEIRVNHPTLHHFVGI